MTQRTLVAVRLPTGSTMLEALDRIWADGDAVLPLDPRLPEAAVQRLITSLRPGALVHPGSEPAHPRKVALSGGLDVAPGTALVVPTSGTTGEPKGVELTHGALRASVTASISRLGCSTGDRWLLCLPLHHVAGILVALRSRTLGTDPVVHSHFDVDAVADEHRATHVSLVPTQLRRLLDTGADLTRFATVLLGGSPAAPDLLDEAAAAGVSVVTSYGMTETSGGCVYDGIPLEGVDVRVTSDQRIAIRGPVVMRGYRCRPDLTGQALHAGWLITPDRGRFDEDGRLEVLGRMDDVIITGGENVSAGTVATVLRRHPSVRDAAVIGRDDPEWGQVVVAVVVPCEGGVTLEDLRGHAAESLPRHALPRELWTVPELPRDDLGKVSRTALGHLVAASTGRTPAPPS